MVPRVCTCTEFFWYWSLARLLPPQPAEPLKRPSIKPQSTINQREVRTSSCARSRVSGCVTPCDDRCANVVCDEFASRLLRFSVHLPLARPHSTFHVSCKLVTALQLSNSVYTSHTPHTQCMYVCALTGVCVNQVLSDNCQLTPPAATSTLLTILLTMDSMPLAMPTTPGQSPLWHWSARTLWLCRQ